MERAVRQWVDSLSTPPSQDLLADLQRRLSRSYVIYGDMLLLPPSLVDGSIWQANVPGDSEDVLLASICQHVKVTRIAVNRPIPLQGDGTSTEAANVLRAPIHFQPIYGDFGPESAAHPPTQDDFDGAYWVTARQNGIAQSWAPRWTMFSRGNISEKARLLELASVTEAVADSGPAGSSAVDLYAGIGYFTFSYVKVGIAKVLCWELNDWSCEGLRRGAEANRWQHKTWHESDMPQALTCEPERIVVFNESNENAPRRMLQMRQYIPPVRHVNCGLLPSSSSSWAIALDMLDAERGGWIHVHENFALKDIESSAEGVRQAFQQLFDERSSTRSSAVLESINRVKSYAPGVFHCVLDIFVPGHVRTDLPTTARR